MPQNPYYLPEEEQEGFIEEIHEQAETLLKTLGLEMTDLRLGFREPLYDDVEWKYMMKLRVVFGVISPPVFPGYEKLLKAPLYTSVVFDELPTRQILIVSFCRALAYGTIALLNEYNKEAKKENEHSV